MNTLETDRQDHELIAKLPDVLNLRNDIADALTEKREEIRKQFAIRPLFPLKRVVAAGWRNRALQPLFPLKKVAAAGRKNSTDE